MDFILAAFVIVILLLFILNLTSKFGNTRNQGKLPPGPKGYPIIGNAAQIGKLPHHTFAKWAKQYGKIYRVKLGSRNVIVISEPNLLREVFSQSPDFTGRMNSVCIHDAYDDSDKPHGLINTEGDEWEGLRRFTMKTLRDFGVGKRSMEFYIRDEVDATIKKLQSFQGEPVRDLHTVFRLPVIGSLWTIVCGERIQAEDEENYHNLGKIIDRAFRQMAEKGGILYLAPWLRHIAPEWSGFNGFRSMMRNLRTVFNNLVTHHQENDASPRHRNYIDIFLQEISKTLNIDSPFFGNNGEKHLIATLIDFFMAGTDTTTSFFLWTIFLLGKHRKVQARLQAEIDAFADQEMDARITLEHAKKMPYTEAVISEVQRFGSVLPLGVPHRARVNSTIGEYMIPKGSIIFANLHYIHHEEIWGDPGNFRPERFFSDDHTCKAHPALVPYSSGRRQCLGEGLAKASIFLFITTIFQNFDVHAEGDLEDVSEGIVGVTLQPKAFLSTFTRRRGS